MLFTHSAVTNHRSALAHSNSSQQRITCRTAASPLSRRVAPCIDAAAHGLPVCASTNAGRPCSISRLRNSVATAAAGSAGTENTGAAAGKESRWSRNKDSSRGRSTGKPRSSSRNSARGTTADHGSDRSATRAAPTRRRPTGHQSQQRFKRPKKDRDPYDINADLKACNSVAKLQQLVQQDGPAMNYVNLAAAIVQLQRILSKLSRQQQPQVTQAADDLFIQVWQLQQPNLPQCKARQLANMIYSVSLLPTPWQQQYQCVVAQHLLPAFIRQLSRANPQDVSNVLYGMAASGQQLPQQSTELLTDRLVAVLLDANPQDIANALWAVAKMQQQSKPMQLQQLAFCAVAQTTKPQEVANTLWAVATMKQQVQPMQQQVQPMTSMHQQVEPRLLEQLLCAFVMQLSDAVPQNVSNTLWACAEFRYLPKQLLPAPGLIDKLATATPQQLANVAWACAQLGYKDEQLLSALLSRVLDLVGTGKRHLISRGVTAQNLANVCWSLAVLDLREHASAVLTLVQAARPLWASMAPEGISQLCQSHMWLIDHSLVGGQGLAGVLTAQELQQCQATWHEMLYRQANMDVTTFQQSVFDAFHRMPIKWLVPPAMEQVSLGADGQPDGAVLIDITAKTADGVWLAIEADGPTHFRRPGRDLMGPTLYRNRALAVRGYVLISVPLYEWQIQRSAEQKQQYLLDKVTAALQQAAVHRRRPQLKEIAH